MLKRCLLVLAVAAVLAQGCGMLGIARKEEPQEIVYICRRAEAPINVDGVLDEPAWEKAAPLRFMLRLTHEDALSQTDGRVLWDDDYLYVGFRADDQDVFGYLTEHDDGTCSEDVLEVFIQTDPEQPPYYNFEVNALGTMLDGFTPRRGAGGGRWQRWMAWDIEGMKVAPRVRGTINDWKDKDEGWDLEIAIPFSQLETIDGRTPQPGDRWKFHLARYDYSVYLEEGRELTTTALLNNLSYHHYEDWSILLFAE